MSLLLRESSNRIINYNYHEHVYISNDTKLGRGSNTVQSELSPIAMEFGPSPVTVLLN
jgi:hypothetical protein